MSIKDKQNREEDKSFFNQILKKTHEGIVGKIASLIVAGIVAIVSVVAMAFWVDMLDWVNDFRNISHEEAMGIAKSNIGPMTQEIIPFRNRESQKQFIAARIADPDPSAYSKVILLEGAKNLYHSLDTGIVFFFSSFGGEAFGVQDIDDDGTKEIYAITSSGGSGVYSVTAQVYSTGNKKLYEYSAGGQYSRTSKPTESTNEQLENEKITIWMINTVDEYISLLGVADGEGEEVIWERNNGAGFSSGRPVFHKVDGPIQLKTTVACRIDDGAFEWISFFHGPVYAFDKELNIHHILYLPSYYSNHVTSMILGVNHLWFGVGINDGLLAYNIDDQSLVIVPIPEIEDVLRLSENQREVIGYLSIEGSEILFEPALSSQEPFSLTLPEAIDSTNEFSETFECE